MITNKKNTEKGLFTDQQKDSGREKPTQDNKNANRLSADLDVLEDLLRKQIKLIREGKISKLAALSEQTSSVIEKLHRSGIFESADFQKNSKHLMELYRQLILIAEAGKQQIAQQLQKVSEGRKTLKAYRNA